VPAFGGPKEMLYKVYVLKSIKDRKRYIGYTSDIKKRLKQHNHGEVKSTYRRRPLKLIYLEEYNDILEAKRRERFLKTGQGRKYLDKILLAKGER